MLTFEPITELQLSRYRLVLYKLSNNQNPPTVEELQALIPVLSELAYPSNICEYLEQFYQAVTKTEIFDLDGKLLVSSSLFIDHDITPDMVQ